MDKTRLFKVFPKGKLRPVTNKGIFETPPGVLVVDEEMDMYKVLDNCHGCNEPVYRIVQSTHTASTPVIYSTSNMLCYKCNYQYRVIVLAQVARPGLLE